MNPSTAGPLSTLPTNSVPHALEALPLTVVEELLDQAVRNAIQTAERFGGLKHPGVKGLFREALIESVITPMLACPYKAGTGVVVNWHGHESAQNDIIIWDDSIYPPFFAARGAGIYGLKSVVAVIEIKSSLTANGSPQDAPRPDSVRQMHHLDPDWTSRRGGAGTSSARHPVRVQEQFQRGPHGRRSGS